VAVDTNAPRVADVGLTPSGKGTDGVACGMRRPDGVAAAVDAGRGVRWAEADRDRRPVEGGAGMRLAVDGVPAPTRRATAARTGVASGVPAAKCDVPARGAVPGVADGPACNAGPCPGVAVGW